MDFITPTICRCPQCQHEATSLELVHPLTREQSGQCAYRLPRHGGAVVYEFRPTEEEREALIHGENIRLVIWPQDRADHHLPKAVAVEVTPDEVRHGRLIDLALKGS